MIMLQGNIVGKRWKGDRVWKYLENVGEFGYCGKVQQMEKYMGMWEKME